MIRIRSQRFHATALAMVAWTAVIGCEAAAQDYPVKPIRVVIGASPGSNTDFFFRAIAPAMSAALGQQLIADYRVGGGGVVGASTTAKSSPDGYVIGLTSSGFVINPAMVKTLPYDPVRDFTMLGLVVDVPQGLVVHPSLPAKNVKELIALARSRPGQLNCANAGIGTNNHLAGVLFNLLGKVDIALIPYKSTPTMTLDLLTGQVHMSFPSIPGAMMHARVGKLRMLAQTGKMRSATAADTPTMEEAGLPGFAINSGFGLVGPANLPQPIVDRLNAALVRAIQDPASRKLLLDNGADPVGSTPQEHAAFNRTEIARWIKVAKAAGIKPE
jgi:tripartite-type tricarboxylate transporter receptor subunit TctC